MSFLLTSSRWSPSSMTSPLNSGFHSTPASPRLATLQTRESTTLRRPRLLHSLPLHQTLRCTEQIRMCWIIRLQSVFHSSTTRITFLTLVPTSDQEVQVHLHIRVMLTLRLVG